MSTFYDSPNDYRSYLAHHGVKGMKWGVRHEQKRKDRLMKKYNVSSKDYDKANEIAKFKSQPARHVMKTVGKIVGGIQGAGIGLATGSAVTTGLSIAGSGIPTAAAIGIGAAVGPALAIPLGVAAGSAVFGVGATIMENAMREQALGERALQTRNDMYNDIRTRNVRKV